MPLYELMAYLSWWAMPIAYLFSVGCCCDGSTCGDGIACTGCETGTVPASVQIEISGVVDHPSGCSECDDFNGTWEFSNNVSACRYEPTTSIPCTGEASYPICEMYALLSLSSTYLAYWQVTRAHPTDCGSPVGEMSFSTALSSAPFDCCVNTSMINSSGIDVNCLWGSALVRIKAL